MSKKLINKILGISCAVMAAAALIFIVWVILHGINSTFEGTQRVEATEAVSVSEETPFL